MQAVDTACGVYRGGGYIGTKNNFGQIDIAPPPLPD